ncbi:shikimate dehydrogenase [Methylogaea oryzae]|uniref:Shikimate dehydrogenase (NADP(+)) n=1 Tax=Methylogaea oryzae TaxID=1295382 RepID=A0A8D4VR21_9GAMM|nr:shikimate dehydrogenase [Methylogaea oryzae]BBL72545.1 shikimate dehydrogenase (NADP(+)) [Methylogaea oryzae]
MKQPDRYAVFGHPIGHSKSPRIHGLFARQTGQDLEYSALDVPAEDFDGALDGFLRQGGQGLNCTIPLKELAWRRADRCSERARRAKAVNTLKREADGSLSGDNTDGVGLVRDLCGNLGLDLAGKRVLLLGAGGASRGILQPLLAERPHSLVIANRTVDKGEQLAGEFTELGAVSACGFADLAGRRFDIILNATAASLQGDLPPLPEDILAPGGACYDLAYGTSPTAFVLWGRAHGAAVSADGLGMLVEQAAEAFFIWRGVRPDTAPVIRLLSEERGF